MTLLEFHFSHSPKKPGLEYDPVQKKIVCATINIDAEYVENHKQPDLQEIKGALLNEVDVTLDNKIALPVGMYCMPKSMSGEECYTQFKDMMKDVQVCASCVATSHSTENILGG